MCKLYLAVLLAAGATCVQAQTPSAEVPIQPSVDSAKQRMALNKLSACLAQARPGWARSTLAQPYLSDEQARFAGRALSGQDKCIKGDEVEVTFRTSGLVGGLAEHFLHPQVARMDLPRVAQGLSALTPLNASEDFAFCVAAGDPAAARDLVLSDPGSDAEIQVARRIAPHVPACIAKGDRLTVDLQALRALISVALYRESTTLSGSTAQ
jgi:hypothetical protein